MALLLDHLGLGALEDAASAGATPGAPGAAAGEGGAPLQLSIASIDEDPDQPRTEFDAEALQELAQTIAARGVRQPVSVRPHPTQPGRWMLNFGARRLRASRLAGKAEIPAFVDGSLDSYDQVIENEQRAALRPLELALFVQRRMAMGESQAEIARGMGKSRGYLTFVNAMVDPPDWLMDLYRSGRCRGLMELYELRRLHKTNGPRLLHWLATQSHVGRAEVQAYKLQASGDAQTPATPGASNVPPMAVAGATVPASTEATLRPVVVPLRPVGGSPAADRSPKPSGAPTGAIRLWARHGRDEVTIDVTAVPEIPGQVFVRVKGAAGTGQRIAMDAGSLVLLRIGRD
jgi:ParB family chromosome partitioning protein